MNISNIAHKINILGGRVVGNNDFSIAYTQNERMYCIRFKLNGEIDKHLQLRDDIEDVYVSDYFTTIVRLDDKRVIYTKYSDDGEILPEKSKILVPSIQGARIANGVYGDTKAIMCRTQAGELYVMNYQGKKYAIKAKEYNSSGKILTIVYDEADNEYCVGYGWPRYNSALNASVVMNLIEKPSNENEILVTFNSELENIIANVRALQFNE